MVEMAVRPLLSLLDEQHSISRRLLGISKDPSVQLRHVRNEVRELREQPTTAPAKPIDPHQTLPLVAEITRLEVQLFDNLARKANQKAQGKSAEEPRTSN